jgi:para-nitrobenzyl esterase
MSHESDGLNRRNLLTRGTILAGAGVALSAKASQAATNPQTGETPNLNPPVVQIRAGKIRGFRDGPTLTFLGVPYAQAERFGTPQPVTPWTDIKSTQTFGPVCPIPQQTSVGIDDFVFPTATGWKTKIARC